MEIIFSKNRMTISWTLLGLYGVSPAAGLIFVLSCLDDSSGDRGGPATAGGLCRGDAR